jgi:hypothetical protein
MFQSTDRIRLGDSGGAPNNEPPVLWRLASILVLGLSCLATAMIFIALPASGSARFGTILVLAWAVWTALWCCAVLVVVAALGTLTAWFNGWPPGRWGLALAVALLPLVLLFAFGAS